MKKIAIIISAVMAFSGALRSQTIDTITMSCPPDAYYQNDQWMANQDTLIRTGMGFNPAQVWGLARYFHFDDTTTVYGIAVMVEIDWMDTLYSVDATLDQVAEDLQLYEYRMGSFVMATNEQLHVHFRDTLPSYYLDLTQAQFNYPYGSPIPPCPVHERYFRNPVAVSDSVFVAITNNHHHQTPEGMMTSPGIHVSGFLPVAKYRSCMPGQILAYRWNLRNAPMDTIWEPRSEYSIGRLFLYPIIAPPDTTTPPHDTIVNPNDTVNPGDTTGVGLHGADLIYRYTSLQPNPATDRVRVLSSFGITAIEAYDLRGRLVYTNTFKHSHIHTFSLDVSSWPRGTYLLRILTPAGPTTKKLLIQ